MNDTVCLVTGANGGIGQETARALAARGATVVMAGRDAAKEWFAAHSVTFSIEAIKQATGKGRVFAKVGDAARAIVTFAEAAVPIAAGE